jgi:hypothetical protein
MPFLWEQIVDLTYKPSFDVVRVEEAVSALIIRFFFLFIVVALLISRCCSTNFYPFSSCTYYEDLT